MSGGVAACKGSESLQGFGELTPWRGIVRSCSGSWGMYKLSVSMTIAYPGFGHRKFICFCSFFPVTAGSPASIDTLHVHTLVSHKRPGEALYNYIEPFYAEHIREFCHDTAALQAARPVLGRPYSTVGGPTHIWGRQYSTLGTQRGRSAVLSAKMVSRGPSTPRLSKII